MFNLSQKYKDDATKQITTLSHNRMLLIYFMYRYLINLLLQEEFYSIETTDVLVWLLLLHQQEKIAL